MYEKHRIHYYEEDGDILLKANNTTFLVHKLILSLSSGFFKDLLKHEYVKVFENQSSHTNKTFLTIELNGENSDSIERMLSFIYPNTVITITWDNIINFSRISNQFKIYKLGQHCTIFLLQNFQSKPLLTIKLAEEYSFSEIYKETSKLILDDFQKYYSDPNFKVLSTKTQLKLYECWINYVSKLQEFIQKYRECLVCHNNVKISLSRYIFEKFPMTTLLKPSLLINTFKSITFCSYYNGFICDSTKRIVNNYEPLISAQTDVWYIFIDLED